MNTTQLILLRLYAQSLGRIPFCALMLKRLLIFMLISKKKEKYVAAAAYFDYKDLAQQERNYHEK